MASQEEALKQGGFKYLELKKEISIEWDGNPEKVVIKQMSNEELSFCRRQANEVRLIGKETVVKFDQELFKDLVIQKGIFSAPFKPDLSDIRKLNPAFVNALANEIVAYNKLSDEKKED